MKCDKLFVYCKTTCDPQGLYYSKPEVDEAIAELKKKCEAEKSIGATFSKNGADLARWVEELRTEIESLKATHDAEMMDAGMRERKLKRALRLARAELCHRLDVDRYLRNHRNSWYNKNCLTWAEACVAMNVKMCKAESKCRDKAEEYK